MRIMWWSDAACHSGFAQVTHNIGERLIRDFGHDVFTLGSNDRGDYWDTPLRRYPASLFDEKDRYGASRVIELLGKETPDVVVMVNDPTIVLSLLTNNRYDPDLVLWRGVSNGATSYKPPILAYLTRDGYDAPRSTEMLVNRVQRIAMSHFGQRSMPEAPVIWHGVDTNVYKPVNRTAAKRQLGYDPDTFLVVRSDKNSTRKDYPATYKALRPLMRKYPDIRVHFHCLPNTLDGYDLLATMWNDEDIRDRVNFSPGITGYTGWPEEHLALLLAAADLHVSTSWGEGFGLNLLQSLACGTPVVATDGSAVTEVVGPGGVLVPPAGRIGTPQGQEQLLPDIEGFTAAIERLYLDRKTRKQLGAAGVEHAARFSWDTAAEKFDALIRRAIESPAGKGPSGAVEKVPVATGVA
jgi:glycosyltransferase involved in cell wall biosynthesis